MRMRITCLDCFHLFDEDQLGLIQDGDMKNLMNLLHEVDEGETVKGNIRGAWNKMRFNTDDRVDFKEFTHHHGKFPMVFQPAIRLQRDMQACFFGPSFWDAKKERMAAYRQEMARTSPEGIQASQEAQRKEKKAQRVIRKNMGVVRYYFFPCLRSFYREPEEEPPSPLEPDKSAIKKLREMEYQKLKNPDTLAHEEYQRIVQSDPHYFPERLKGGEKNRRNRAVDRQQRKQLRRERLREKT